MILRELHVDHRQFRIGSENHHVSNPERMKTRELCLLTIACSLLQLIGVTFFARGFFPYKKVLPGFAAKVTVQDYEFLGLKPFNPPEKVFDKLVFIVIDALRRQTSRFLISNVSDFMFSADSAMSFVHRFALLNAG